jgi:hypothetical protein
MVDFQINLGQIAVGTLVAIVGWFLKREIVGLHTRADKLEETVAERVDKVEDTIFKLSGEVQKLIGAFHIK